MSLFDNLPVTIDIHSIAVFLLKRKRSEWSAHSSFHRRRNTDMKKKLRHSLQLAASFNRRIRWHLQQCVVQFFSHIIPSQITVCLVSLLQSFFRIDRTVSFIAILVVITNYAIPEQALDSILQGLLLFVLLLSVCSGLVNVVCGNCQNAPGEDIDDIRQYLEK